MPLTVEEASEEVDPRQGINYLQQYLADGNYTNSHLLRGCYHSKAAGNTNTPAFAKLALVESVRVKLIKVLMRKPTRGGG